MAYNARLMSEVKHIRRAKHYDGLADEDAENGQPSAGDGLRVLAKKERELAAIVAARTPEQQKQYNEWSDKHLATFWRLREHRIRAVRPEARSALMAYAFLRGRALGSLETKASDPEAIPASILAKSCEIAERFSEEDKRVTRQRFWAWAEHEDPVKNGSEAITSIKQQAKGLRNLKRLLTGN